MSVDDDLEAIHENLAEIDRLTRELRELAAESDPAAPTDQ